MVKTYSKKKHGNKRLSAHFRLYEFACSDGTDTVKVSTTNLKMLEKIRAKFGGSITITSGNRSYAYNKKIGGASNSAHVTGRAVDFVVYDKKGKAVSGKKICKYLESQKWKWGIGYMGNATHMDTKFTGNRMDETKKDKSDRNGYYTLQRHGQTFHTYFGSNFVVAASTLNIRKKPTTKSAVMGKLKKGQKVKGQILDNWLKLGSGRYCCIKDKHGTYLK